LKDSVSGKKGKRECTVEGSASATVSTADFSGKNTMTWGQFYQTCISSVNHEITQQKLVLKIGPTHINLHSGSKISLVTR
jgi:hypothetical protein